MSQRYTPLYSMPASLYAPGAPMILCAGTLLYDSATAGVVVQLKLRSIDNRPIKAMKVRIQSYDVFGAPLGEPTEHQLLDLAAIRDGEFWTGNPLRLPFPEARSFRGEITAVAFHSGEFWTGDGTPCETLPPQLTLEQSLEHPELVRQYRIHLGTDCAMMPRRDLGLWRCTCGAVNHDQEAFCHNCRRGLQSLEECNTETLRTAMEARLEQERQQSERQRQLLLEQQEQERQRQEQLRLEQEARKAARKKKLKTILTVLAVVAVIAGGAALFVTQFLIPSRNYDRALELLESGSYREAMDLFGELEGFKDSEERLREAKYRLALSLFEAEDYRGSGDLLSGLAGYRDADEYIAFTAIQRKMEDGAYLEAYEALEAGTWKILDPKLIENCKYDCLYYYVADGVDLPLIVALDYLNRLPQNYRGSGSLIQKLSTLQDYEGTYLQQSRYGNYYLRIKFLVTGGQVRPVVEYTNYSGTLQDNAQLKTVGIRVPVQGGQMKSFDYQISVDGTFGSSVQNFVFYITKDEAYATCKQWDVAYTLVRIPDGSAV